MEKSSIEKLFNDYLVSFKSYNIDDVAKCYHLPCTLNTPDNVVYLSGIKELKQEFSNIFTQLKQANTKSIIARKASYLAMTKNLFLVCIDWDFIDDKAEVFADFCAIYHLTLVDNELKIFNVVSHDLSNSLTLEQPLALID